MNFLLELPIWLGLLIVVSIVTITGLMTVTQLKKRIEHKITKQHEKVGRILFRVTAGLIALLISLSYANERMEQYKITDSMEMEASIIVNTAIKLNILQTEEAEIIKKKLINYINYTIADNWGNVKNDPFFSSTSSFLIETINLAYELPVDNQKDEKIKDDIIDEINQITKLMQVRIYSRQTLTPYLTYILFIGLIFMWIFFTVYDLDVVTLSFLSLYNIFIAILIYFVFMLSNPLEGPLKIDPHSFIIMKTKGFDNQSK
jgi:hypothetical protein